MVLDSAPAYMMARWRKSAQRVNCPERYLPMFTYACSHANASLVPSSFTDQVLAIGRRGCFVHSHILVMITANASLIHSIRVHALTHSREYGQLSTDQPQAIRIHSVLMASDCDFDDHTIQNNF